MNDQKPSGEQPRAVVFPEIVAVRARTRMPGSLPKSEGGFVGHDMHDLARLGAKPVPRVMRLPSRLERRRLRPSGDGRGEGREDERGDHRDDEDSGDAHWPAQGLAPIRFVPSSPGEQ